MHRYLFREFRTKGKGEWTGALAYLYAESLEQAAGFFCALLNRAEHGCETEWGLGHDWRPDWQAGNLAIVAGIEGNGDPWAVDLNEEII